MNSVEAAVISYPSGNLAKKRARRGTFETEGEKVRGEAGRTLVGQIGTWGSGETQSVT